MSSPAKQHLDRLTGRRDPSRAYGRPGRRGFTLVETLAAGVILTLWAVVLGGAASRGVRSLAIARDTQRASELLERVLTKVDLIGPARLMADGPTEGVFEAPHDAFRWRTEIDSRTEADLYEVAVRISWRMPNGQERSVEAKTLINDPPGSRQLELNWSSL